MRREARASSRGSSVERVREAFRARSVAERREHRNRNPPARKHSALMGIL
jgi:hypothetical protein